VPVERLPDQAVFVPVPGAVVVVRVDDRDPAVVRARDRGRERAEPLAERAQQLLAVVVAEVVDDIYE
jgi:hypothetical protein